MTPSIQFIQLSLFGMEAAGFHKHYHQMSGIKEFRSQRPKSGCQSQSQSQSFHTCHNTVTSASYQFPTIQDRRDEQTHPMSWVTGYQGSHQMYPIWTGSSATTMSFLKLEKTYQMQGSHYELWWHSQGRNWNHSVSIWELGEKAPNLVTGGFKISQLALIYGAAKLSRPLEFRLPLNWVCW